MHLMMQNKKNTAQISEKIFTLGEEIFTYTIMGAREVLLSCAG